MSTELATAPITTQPVQEPVSFWLWSSAIFPFKGPAQVQTADGSATSAVIDGVGPQLVNVGLISLAPIFSERWKGRE